jgi:hypothetical protein
MLQIIGYFVVLRQMTSTFQTYSDLQVSTVKTILQPNYIWQWHAVCTAQDRENGHKEAFILFSQTTLPLRK